MKFVNAHNITLLVTFLLGGTSALQADGALIGGLITLLIAVLTLVSGYLHHTATPTPPQA